MKLSALPGASLTGIADVPGDKSCTHRAVLLAAMAEGESRIEGALDADDTRATIAAVEALGATVVREGAALRVHGGAWHSPAAPIDCGNSGTLARLVAGAVAGRDGVSVDLVGDASLSRRPMARVAQPLRKMGASVEGGDTLPLRIAGARLGGIAHRNSPASAQVKTAILFAGLGSAGPVEIDEPLPSRDHGEIMLGAFGADVDVADGRITLGAARTLRPATIRIGRDPSSAAFPFLAAAICPGSMVRVEGMNVNPHRTGFLETLERMGATLQLSGERVESGEILADVTLFHSRLNPCEVEAEAIPAMIDEIPALAVACAFADGESVLHGLGELRHKESDRLSAILLGLTACGVAANVQGDTLRIFGRGADRVRGGAVAAMGDHRIAMAFACLGLGSRGGVTIDDASAVATSYPGFVAAMRALGAEIETQ